MSEEVCAAMCGRRGWADPVRVPPRVGVCKCLSWGGLHGTMGAVSACPSNPAFPHHLGLETRVHAHPWSSRLFVLPVSLTVTPQS